MPLTIGDAAPQTDLVGIDDQPQPAIGSSSGGIGQRRRSGTSGMRVIMAQHLPPRARRPTRRPLSGEQRGGIKLEMPGRIGMDIRRRLPVQNIVAVTQ